jgi:DNA-binding MarR family transcriptional regulator
MADELVSQCAGTVMDTFHAMMRSIGAEMRKDTPKELSMQQFRAMRTVKRVEGVSVSHLAEHLGSTLSAASRLIDGLVEKGYVHRETAGDDRRRLILGLTESGEQALDAVHLQAVSFLAERLDGLTQGECAMINLAMDLLRTKLVSSQTDSGKKPTPTQANGHSRLPVQGE